MSYVAAVWTNGHAASGNHHGEAYGNLSWKEQLSSDICSGHLNPDGTFTTEMEHPNKNLVIIRHGESEYNTGITEELDSGLTQKGYCQIETVAFFLRQRLTGYIGYVSPLLRCLQTARLIRQQTGITFNVIPEISEFTQRYPQEGISVPSRTESYPEFNWPAIQSQMHFPKEPDFDFLERLKLVFSQISSNSLIITHGSVVMTLCEIALGLNVHEIPKWDNSIDNASISFVSDGTVLWFGKKVENL